MEDFANILQRDYGLKPQGKAGPIGGTRGNGSGSGGENGSRKEGGMARAGRNGSVRGSVLDQDSDELFGDDIFGLGSNGNVKPPGGRSDATLDPFGLSSGYDDVFGGPPKYSSPTFASMSNHDDIFRVGTKPQPAMLKNANSPLFDTPVYDDDIFGGVPGIRSSAGVFDDVFSGGTAAPSVSLFDDLLGGYSAGERKESRTPRGSSPARPSAPEERDSIFEDLLSGVSSVESSKPRWSADAKPRQHPDSRGPVDRASTAEDAPSFVDPIISIMKQTSFPWMDESQEGVSEDIDDRTPARNDAGLDENLEHYQAPNDSYFPKSVKESRQKDIGSSMLDSSMKDRFGPPDASSNSDSPSVLLEADTLEAAFLQHLPRRESDIRGPTSNLGFTEGYGFPSFETNVDPSSVQLETEMGQAGGDEWLTIDEVKLATAPSTMPPPSRQAPFLPNERQSFSFQTYFQREQNIPDYKSESSSQGSPEDLPFYRQSGSSTFAQCVQNDVMAAAAARGIDGLEDFVSSVLNKSETSSWPQEEVDGATEGGGYQGEVKDPMNRGEVKLRLAKEAREKDREDKKKEAKVARAAAREKEGKEAREQILREAKEKQAREREKQEKERLAKEEKEREKQRKERVREREREREKDRAAERAAVERATAEARDRALTEARERAERAVVERATAEARERAAAEAKERAERAAVERAAAEARERAAAEAKERAERAAVERAAAEARERAAAEAKERAERAAADKAAAEARERAERAAVERATSEARERASAEARARAAAESRARAERAATESVAAEVRERAAERAAAEARERAERATAEKAREQQRRNDNDLDRLFNMTTRANSEPRQRPQNFDFTSDQRTSQAFGNEGQQRRPPPSTVKKVPSTTNIDDWTSLFAPSAAQDEFQEIEGETPDRRRARLERHERTMERAAKALADKNQRDLDMQFEQAEKQRAGEVLDTEIRRWAAGKEGNLRALLSTLQYVLWPECGWQPISLTDIISAIAVKKAYRKATLCVHPDKVQQKGATVQQKYIAEKVFDLLKEAWNKFNSEELF